MPACVQAANVQGPSPSDLTLMTWPRGPTDRLVLAALIASLLVAGPAQAGVDGSIEADMTELDEIEVTAELTLTGNVSERLRSAADDNGDGQVGPSEVDGTALAAEDRLEGDRDALSLDGRAYVAERQDVDFEGLEGPTNRSTPMEALVEVRAEVQPSEGSTHELLIEGPETGIGADANVTVRLQAPEGYAFTEASGLELSSTCQAAAETGITTARLELERRDEACTDPIPAPSAFAVLAAAGLALAARARY